MFLRQSLGLHRDIFFQFCRRVLCRESRTPHKTLSIATLSNAKLYRIVFLLHKAGVDIKRTVMLRSIYQSSVLKVVSRTLKDPLDICFGYWGVEQDSESPCCPDKPLTS